MSLLYALARGHALVHGRRQLTEDDLPLVARAALESTPNDRRAVMRLLLAKDGVASTGDVRGGAPLLRADRPGDPGDARQARDRPSSTNPGPPEPATLTLADPLRWLLDEPPLTIEKKPTPSTAGIETNLTPSTNGAEEIEVERLAEAARKAHEDNGTWRPQS